jgi:hypothetical protein
MDDKQGTGGGGRWDGLEASLERIGEIRERGNYLLGYSSGEDRFRVRTG